MGSKTLQNTKITFNTIAKDLDNLAKSGHTDVTLNLFLPSYLLAYLQRESAASKIQSHPNIHSIREHSLKAGSYRAYYAV